MRGLIILSVIGACLLAGPGGWVVLLVLGLLWLAIMLLQRRSDQPTPSCTCAECQKKAAA